MGSSKVSDKVKIKLSKWQKKFVLDGFDDPLRIACTGIGAGKTRALAIWIVLQCLRKPGLRGIVIAQIYKTLTRVLVREIQVVCALLGVRYDYNKSSMEMVLPFGSTLFFYSADNPTGLLGLSEIDLLAIDEAAFSKREVFDYAHDRMRGGKYEPMVRLISSPLNDELENWFKDLCYKHPECVINAASYDNPFVSASFIQDLKDRYGEGTPLYQQQVEGRLLDTDVSSQIVKRSDFVKTKQYPSLPGYWLGCDFSGGVGCDSDCIIVIDETGVVEHQLDNSLNTQQKVAAIGMVWGKYDISSNFVDNTAGFGKGSIDLCAEKGIKLNGVNFSEKAFKEDAYPNLRTECYMELADAIRAGLWVPEEIQKEILAQRMFIDKRGRVALVPKDLVKKQLGHSPDSADALALAVYARNHGALFADEKDDYTAEEASDALDRMLAACSY
jgi:PBSX family phage terminase large subunit